MDVSQDWTVQEGFEQNGTTVLRFSRKLNTCDSTDEPITVNTTENIATMEGSTLIFRDINLNTCPSYFKVESKFTSEFAAQCSMIIYNLP